MNLDELIELKKYIKKKYENEREEFENNTSRSDKFILVEELNDISKELIKVDKIIKIYQNNTENKKIIFNLERLYMQTLSDLDEKKFNVLTENELFDLFNKYFPDEWVFMNDDKEKENLLLAAICDNKMIEKTVLQKNLNIYYGEN